MVRSATPMVALLLLAGCERSLIDLSDGTTATPTPTGTTTPTPTPTPPLTTGDGHDGAFVATGTMTINECFPVTSTSTDTIVSPGNNFAVGRSILVIQMQDGFATSGDAADVTAPGSAGQWELARVSAAGSTLTVEVDLSRTYSSAAPQTAQVCSVPEYTDVTVGGGDSITSDPWSGATATGGVLAFYASGTVTLDGVLRANGDGFRGGIQNGAGNTTTGVVTEDTTQILGSGKGEGLDSLAFGLHGCGNMATGGGGGNTAEAGGGGGGNGGAGGTGGKETDFMQTGLLATQGRGGRRAVLPASTHLFLGGGGGGGHIQSTVTATSGGRGGGIVLVIANSLSGIGAIRSSGGSALGANEAGAGGGGAGGTILLVLTTSSFTGDVVADGGQGGGTTDATFHHGPGGGGGGGRVRLEGVPGATVDVSGGLHGTSSLAATSDWFSTDGSDGVQE